MKVNKKVRASKLTAEEQPEELSADQNISYDVNNPPVVVMESENHYSDGDDSAELTKKGKKAKSGKTKSEKGGEWQELYALAELLNTSVKELKEEFVIFQMKKLMAKLGKVIVRYNVSDSDMEKVLFMADKLGFGRLVLAPINLPLLERKVRKHGLEHIPVSSVIDFPFGESAFNSKVFDIKESKKIGVDEVLCTMPAVMVSEQNISTFRKQCKKIARLYKDNSGVVINASDLNASDIKRALKAISKTRLSSVAIAFGKATLSEVKEKMTVVKGLKGNKKIYVMANVDTLEAFMELNKLDADIVLTPFADKIGAMIIKKFGIKGSKLV